MFITGLQPIWKISSIVILLSCIYQSRKKPAKFAVEVCGSEKLFAVAEVQKITTNVPQACGFAVADHSLLFCGICGCGIEFKLAVPSTAKRIFRTPTCFENTLARRVAGAYHGKTL